MTKTKTQPKTRKPRTRAQRATERATDALRKGVELAAAKSHVQGSWDIGAIIGGAILGATVGACVVGEVYEKLDKMQVPESVLRARIDAAIAAIKHLRENFAINSLPTNCSKLDGILAMLRGPETSPFYMFTPRVPR